MELATQHSPASSESELAELTRHMLLDAHVFAVSVVGGPGSGKTELINATIRSLEPEIRVGVIACEVATSEEAAISDVNRKRVSVKVAEPGLVSAGQIHNAICSLDLRKMDILFIENVGSLTGPVVRDLGQNITAAIFSVAAGDDKARRHPEIVKGAPITVLNKMDLAGTARFNVSNFCSDVQRLNPHTELFEVTALQQPTLGGWLNCLCKHAGKQREIASWWFG
jgi:hydrogenase nickel incorporation protein HypB